ncbi:MAG: flagellar motor protein MotB, partial [Zetaproteobacteria bacterium]|nr:flagellar motor protein MotB [Zetaproteobacteria bacterium]
ATGSRGIIREKMSQEVIEDSSQVDEEPAKMQVKKSEALWMMSFSDMSLVLMCFFALLLSTMKPDKEKFKHVKEGFVEEVRQKKDKPLSQVAKEVKETIEEKKLAKVASVNQTSDGLAIEFKDGILFSPGFAELKRGHLATLKAVMQVVADVGEEYDIRIEGHTDDVALGKKNRYRSNWELSAARAASMLQQFVSLGIPEHRLQVVGFAHTRPKQKIVGLRGRELKQARALNRRVVIWIY